MKSSNYPRLRVHFVFSAALGYAVRSRCADSYMVTCGQRQSESFADINSPVHLWTGLLSFWNAVVLLRRLMLVMAPNDEVTAPSRSSSEVADRSSSRILPGLTTKPMQVRRKADSIRSCSGGDPAGSPSDACSSRGRCPIILEEQPRDRNPHGWSAGRRDGENP